MKVLLMCSTVGLKERDCDTEDVESEREDEKSGEGGIFPSSHEVSSLQFQVESVISLQKQENSVTRRLTSHVLIPSERWDDRVLVVHQVHLELTEHRWGFGYPVLNLMACRGVKTFAKVPLVL